MSQIKYTGAPIAKDQCFYCFRTPFDDQGLNISTKHSKSYCNEHLSQHYNFDPLDTIYLNLVKVKKEQEQPSKIIKLEIKQEREQDLYDIQTQLFQFDGSNKTEIEANTETLTTIDKIINSDSINKKQELKSWQQEILPCEHTIEFKQSPISQLDLNKCGECELTENLWICLTCGKLGCGRAQFGGVAGNTHALQHFETAQHPIAVKLGSLSKDVTDVYCYACNDEISFPNLAECLQTFNIDLNNFVKTEKSLVELQLEQNLKWEFNMENSKGEKLPSIYGSGLTGFKNLGNSCYLSSVLQTLFSLPEYQSFQNGNLSEFNEVDGLKFQLIKISKGLLSGEFSKPNNEGYQIGIQPSSFKTIIGENHDEFSSMRQQDAFEFWNYLVDKIDEIDSNLNDIFRFIQVEKFNFKNNEIKLNKQINENITLQSMAEVDHIDDDGKKIYKNENFIDLLQRYLSPEEIEWKNSGGQYETITKRNIFKSFPKYLVTTIQRIQLENWVPIKTDVAIKLPTSFDLNHYQPSSIIENNETEIQEETPQFQPNQESLNNLLQMGFPEVRATKALYITGNSNTEIAMNWLFEHLEDPTIDDPIEFKPQDSEPVVDPNAIESLQNMGFGIGQSKKALILNKNDVNSAIEWLFANPNDDGVLPDSNSSQKDDSNKFAKFDKDVDSNYGLKAVICHKGTQITSGHYVVFIKKQGKWVLFNDEKVVDVSGDENSWVEIEKNGYVYLWERT